MMRPNTLAALAALAMLGGCARMKPGLGFDDVQASVADRTGMSVHWDSGSPSDDEARIAVRRLLADELGAREAVQIALLNNHDLQAVYEELNLAQADLVEAGLLRNPVFSGEVRWATDGGGTGVALDLSQDFLSLLFIPLRKGRAEAQFEAAKLRVTGEVLDLMGRVQAAFYAVQAGEQLLEMRRTVVDATAASYELAKRLHAAGNNRDLDVANERALHEQSRLDLAAAEAEGVQRRERLNELMGVWGTDTRWRVGARLPELPAEAAKSERLEARAIESSLELGLARREIEVAARTLGIARPFGGIDEVDVGVAAEREPEGGWSVGPSVSFPIPIFDRNGPEVASARARLRQAQQRYLASAVRLRAGARAAHAAVVAAAERAAYCQHVLLPLRQRIVDETQLQFNAMQVGAFQLLQAKRDQIESGALYIGTLHDYWQARARLDLILAGRLSEAPDGARSHPISTPTASGRTGGHR